MLLSRNTEKMYLNLILFASLVPWAQGTLTPDGQIWMDCGSEQTFTCSVNHITTGASLAGWTITLDDIAVTEDSGKEAENTHSGRISTSDSSGVTKSSTITITGFTTADNGGTIQCINLDDGSLQGVAYISVGVPSCPSKVMSDFISNCTRANVTWEQPPGGPPVTDATITYCNVSDSSCSNSITCASSCTVPGLDSTINELDSGIDYYFAVTPNNSCGGCGGNLHNPVRDVSECPDRINVTTPHGDVCPKLFWVEDDGLTCKVIIDFFPTGSSRVQRKLTPGKELCTTNCTIPNLQPNTNYTFKVTLVNNCGHSSNCNDMNEMTTSLCKSDNGYQSVGKDIVHVVNLRPSSERETLNEVLYRINEFH